MEVNQKKKEKLEGGKNVNVNVAENKNVQKQKKEVD